MLDDLRQWAGPWGNLASVTGLLLALVGFVITIAGVYRSKSAAQHAREAADETKAILVRANAIADFSAALTIMDEIRRLQRAGAWAVLPDRYSSLREKLMAILASHPVISEAQRMSVGAALEGIRRLEHRVEESLATGSAPPNSAKLNQVLGSHLDILRGVLTGIRVEIKGESDARK